MPGAVSITLAGLAASSWRELWKLYEQRYGKYGEETVRRLQREIEDAKADLASEGKMLDILRDQLHRSDKLTDNYLDRYISADNRANELAARLNEAMIRLERAALPENPYPEPGPSAPDTDEETPS